MKDLQEAQKRLDHILQTEAMKREATEQKLQEQMAGMSTEMQEQMLGLNGKYDHLTTTLATIQLQLLNLSKGKGVMEEESILGGPSDFSSEDINSRNQSTFRGRLQGDHQGIHVISPLPKIEFPRFDGSNPRAWILKCNGYFKLIPNIPDAHKVTLASMHFEGRAALWFQNFSMKQTNLTWSQFLDVVSARFEELKEAKIIAEFNKLKQTGSYNDYVDRFEELKACMLLINCGEYSEEYFIASFVSGLSDELQSFITMFEPNTLQQTIDLGRKQIHTLEAITKKLKQPFKPFSAVTPSNFKRNDTSAKNSSKPNSYTPTKAPVRLLTASEMAARREKGLCYNCDEAFTYGHRCKNRINYMIMTEEEELSYQHTSQEEGLTAEVLEEEMEEIQMSLNVLSGEDGLTTMRLIGEVLKNEGCDMILGGDWLKSCTPIELDYEKMTFTVSLMGKRVKLQALTSNAECNLRLHKLKKINDGPGPK
ncbi:hypothetical protein DH2020_017585 [Rehmannia glutinosa]|uniref:Ty3 transposon capsid-like protein domain-containing protein n=1 Tax=Rehmannia glutinosa TaxID=99300 RepID=A0ABR0WVK1_REHGL